MQRKTLFVLSLVFACTLGATLATFESVPQSTAKGEGTILASRYPLRSRTPNFYARSKASYSKASYPNTSYPKTNVTKR